MRSLRGRQARGSRLSELTERRRKRVYLAGCNDQWFIAAAISGGSLNLLASFFHTGDLNSRTGRSWLFAAGHVANNFGARWILDSGLFSLMFGAASSQVMNDADMLAYADRYLDFVAQYRMATNGLFVELDTHKIAPQLLPVLRQKIADRGMQDFCIYVNHYEDGSHGFAEICTQKHIALSVPEARILSGANGGVFPRLQSSITMARQINEGVYIHLLGCTETGLLHDLDGFDSGDSISWLASVAWTSAAAFLSNGTQVPVRKSGFDSSFGGQLDIVDNEYRKILPWVINSSQSFRGRRAFARRTQGARMLVVLEESLNEKEVG